VDQELRAYLEGMEGRINERFARIDQRFERMDERFERMDGRFERIDERFEKVETEARHTRVLLEGLDNKIQLVAEGVAGVSERLEDFKAETARNFAEVKASFATQHRNLKGSVQELERRVQNLSDVNPQPLV
jgi:archaellum component FlaC